MGDLRISSAVILTLVTGFGCKADRPGGDKPDAAVDQEMLLAPQIDTAVPMETPNDTVAVRGTTSGARIVVKGGPGDPVVKSVLPSGSFCADVMLNPTGPTPLTAYALDNGQISPPAVLTVTKNPAAPIPASALCLGMEEPVCVPENAGGNNCTNLKDDDCNGYTDACDPGCNGCVDDGFGPNWVPFFVPMVPVGTYKLEMCPCRADWFAFQVAQGETIHVKATFVAANIDLDLRLQTPAAAEENVNTSVASSTTTTGIEEITWPATAAGLYYLKVYPYQDDKIAPYTLTIY